MTGVVLHRRAFPGAALPSALACVRLGAVRVPSTWPRQRRTGVSGPPAPAEVLRSVPPP